MRLSLRLRAASSYVILVALRWRTAVSPGFFDFNERITEAIRTWAENHPHPDEPVFMSTNGKLFTPVELAREVGERTEVGRQHLRMFRHLAQVDKEIGPDGLVRMFESSHTPKPATRG